MGIADDDNESKKKKMADLAEEDDEKKKKNKKKSVEGGKDDDWDECLRVIRTRGSSPELKASIPSFLSWQWLRPLIVVGNRKPLEAEDLFDLNPKDGTYYCVQRWQESIVKEKKKKRTTKRDSNGAFPSVWRIMFRSFGKELLLGAICKPIWLTAVLLQVYVLRALVRVTQNSDTEHLHWWWAMILVGAMMITSVTQSVSQHHCLKIGQRVGMKLRATVAMAVFDKLLSMRSAALVGTNSGNMLNLVTNDTQKILDASMYAHFVWFAAVEVSVVGGLVIYEAGVAAVPGVVLVFLTQPLQVKVAQMVGRIRRRAIQYTDARVSSVDEILTGVRVIKYNGWIAAFLKRISDLRIAELKLITKAAFLRASNSTIRDGGIPLVSLVTFGIYVAIHGGAALTPGLAFTVLALFSILIRVYAIAPQGIQTVSEALVAIQRVQRLLDLPDGNGFSSPTEAAAVSAINPDAAIAVVNGTFSWNIQEKTLLTNKTLKSTGKERKEGNQTLAKLQLQETTQERQSASLDRALTNLEGINFEVKRGEFVAIVGTVGSGKSSFLLALLGEMECLKGVFTTDRSVAYVPQQPWILNDTVRDNILFGSKFDEDRYRQTISACALDHDISQLIAGHDTEIGERGVNLSGGQKARLSLARACYSDAPLVLLDDPLAAVDVPTAKHLMEHVLSGILKGRTVVLVTHNKVSLGLCDQVYMMEQGRLEPVTIHKLELKNEPVLNEDSRCDISTGLCSAAQVGEATSSEVQHAHGFDGVSDGNIEALDQFIDKSHRSSVTESMQQEGNSVGEENNRPEESLSKELKLENVTDAVSKLEKLVDMVSKAAGTFSVENSELIGDQEGTKHDSNASRTEAGGMLTVKEDRVQGVVTWATYIQYVRDGGGLAFFTSVMAVFLMGQAMRVMVDYWLSIWVDRKYQLSTRIYVISYACFVGAAITFSLGRALLFTKAALWSARKMHSLMAERVLRSPQLFFDQNPVGRILNRFGKDQAMVDELLPYTAQMTLEMLVSCLGSISIISVLMPWFLLCIPPLGLMFLYFQRCYVAVSRELKRLDGLSRSPLYAHFSETFQGITSVRAYGAEKRMHNHFIHLIDANHRAFIMFVHSSRWLGVRLDFGAAICVTLTALLVVLRRHSIGPGLAGVVLVQSLQITDFFQYGIRMASETENYFTSVERIQAYTVLPTEGNSQTKPGKISDNWPKHGEIDFIHYTLAYQEDLPPVLKDITFKVKAQEKVGILGRTGAGKSSLASALFRLVDNSACSGSILVDGIDIAGVGLDELRQRLSIIPQDPVLFKGTIRLNLDPFERHTDAEINEAISSVHLSKKIKSLTNGVDSLIAEYGANFSVGQRQLLCLARSLLKRSRIIVMDEATAAVDGDTDQLIQTAMCSLFHDCTVLTIAHRLNTIIDCDRVLVLANGQVAEFDTPANLLRNAGNFLSSRSSQNGDQSTSKVYHIFADMVAQSGPALTEQLLKAAEASELVRQSRH